MRHTLRRGFTLIELLLVVIIIGIVASIALPRFASVKESAYIAVLNSDLKTLATSEEIYFNGPTSTYAIGSIASGATANAFSGALNYSPSPDVTTTAVAGTPGSGGATSYIGYLASAVHAKLPSGATKNRCVNMGDVNAAAQTAAVTSLGVTAAQAATQPGLQYSCK